MRNLFKIIITFLYVFIAAMMCCAFSNTSSVVIDAGHGGSDTGAVSDGYFEKEWNLDTSRACANELVKYGVYVYETRTDDIYITLEDRANLANNNNVECFISIHHNSSDESADRGEVIYSIRDNKSKELANNIESELKNIGQTEVKVYYKTTSNGTTDYYSVLRNTSMSAVIIEVCFIDNVEDRKIADTKEERERNGIAIAHGILKQLGISTENKDNTITAEAEHYIISEPTASYDQLYNWAVENNASETYLENLQYIWDKSVEQGVDPILVATQCALETNYMSSYIFKTHNNTAGIKQTSYTYKTYDTVHDGIDAQIKHLKLYAGTMDSDTSSWLWGWCPTVEGLAGRWAEDTEYSNKILSMMNDVYEIKNNNENKDTNNNDNVLFDSESKNENKDETNPLKEKVDEIKNGTNKFHDVFIINKEKTKEKIDEIKSKLFNK